MRSWWSMKSKSIQKIGLPSAWPMGRGGGAAAGEVEGHVPPVVAADAGGQPDLPDDLADDAGSAWCRARRPLASVGTAPLPCTLQSRAARTSVTQLSPV